MNIKIKSMSYEECREDFFANLIRHAENKIKYWKRQTGYRCEIDDNLSNAGAEMQYCQDALQALAKQTPKKYEVWNGQCCCPNCEVLFGDYKTLKSLISWKMDYCKYCGQALDWSDDEGGENE